MDSCAKALAIDPNHTSAWINRGAALAALERYDEAVNSFDKALVVDPNNATTWSIRGSAFDPVAHI